MSMSNDTAMGLRGRESLVSWVCHTVTRVLCGFFD